MHIEKRHISKFAKITAGGALLASSMFPQNKADHSQKPFFEPMVPIAGEVILQPGVMFKVSNGYTRAEAAPPVSTTTPTSTQILPTPQPDRTSCDEIKDTEYRSQSERQFYLDSCVVTPEPTQIPSTPIPTLTPLPTTITTTQQEAGQWQDIVCSPEFQWDCSEAIARIFCESGGDPNAVNPAGPYNGLFQNENGSFDPYQNTLQAYRKYKAWQRGEVPDPWPNCP